MTAARAYLGRETLYEFRAEQDCSVTLSLSDAVDELGVFVFEECPVHWIPTIECGIFGGSLAFDATAGQPQILIVGSYEDNEGTHTIEVDCDCD